MRTVLGVMLAATLVGACGGGEEAESAQRGTAVETAQGESAGADTAGGEKGGGPAAAAPAGGGMPAMPVEVATAKIEAVIDAVEATGTIEAQQSIDLRPEGEGRLVQIYVREGSIVGRGTPLFKIDDAS
ncbi:MAG TPA: biotin/lipoyl-binding protein, partial [Gemmatimonadaceae bacterium]|nr:biotin/lipoyl-binding protein [Gemmatimonadaceae bacterium]